MMTMHSRPLLPLHAPQEHVDDSRHDIPQSIHNILANIQHHERGVRAYKGVSNICIYKVVVERCNYLTLTISEAVATPLIFKGRSNASTWQLLQLASHQHVYHVSYVTASKQEHPIPNTLFMSSAHLLQVFLFITQLHITLIQSRSLHSSHSCFIALSNL